KKADKGFVSFRKPKDKALRKIYESNSLPLSAATIVYSQVAENIPEKEREAFVNEIYTRVQIMTLHNFLTILDSPNEGISQRMSDAEAKITTLENDVTEIKKLMASNRFILRHILRWALWIIQRFRGNRIES